MQPGEDRGRRMGVGFSPQLLAPTRVCHVDGVASFQHGLQEPLHPTHPRNGKVAVARWNPDVDEQPSVDDRQLHNARGQGSLPVLSTTTSRNS